MTFQISNLWHERHDDEHKIRRDDHRTLYQRDRARILTQPHFGAYNPKHKCMVTASTIFTVHDSLIL